MAVGSMRAVRSRCASLLGIEGILGTLRDSIVVRRVWGGYTPRWMGHDGDEKRDNGPGAGEKEKKKLVGYSR